MTFYRAPFAPYCERRESKDPNPALRHPWDGCWAWNTARGADGTTGGKVHGQDEQSIRALAGKPDHVNAADGGTLDDCLRALEKLLPHGFWYSLRPPRTLLIQHLALGGIAILSGRSDNMPIIDREYDPGFYDSKQGHSVIVQGTGDGSTLWWGNPEMFPTRSEPKLPLSVATHFAWRYAGDNVEALLLNSVRLPAPDTVEANPMLPVIDATPTLVDCAKGVQLFDLNGKALTTMSADATGIYSPFVTTGYRAIVVTTHDVKQLVLAKAADLRNARPMVAGSVTHTVSLSVDGVQVITKEV